MHAQLPSRKALTLAWLTLMILTIGTMGAGKVEIAVHLGPLWSSILLILTGLKTGLILWFYLNLRRSSSGWQRGFGVFLLLLLVFILGAYLLTPTT